MIVERDLYRRIRPHLDSQEAIVITGMRRTGKTTLLRFLYEKINSDNKLFLDLENILNRKYFEEEDYERVRANLEVLGLNFKEKAYAFLDEIQFVKNMPSVVKYLSDHYKVKFFLTGSGSFYLKNLFSESLSGRKYIFELFPFSFREFLRLKGERVNIPKEPSKISKPAFEAIDRLYDEFLRYGGFPGVVAKQSYKEKEKALQDVFSSYFQLEVVEFGDFRKTSKVRDLMLLLMQRAGSKIDIQKLASDLGVSRPTVYEYLAFLEGTYFITLVKAYSKSRSVEVRGGEKVYVCDSGLLNNTAQVSEGALFENNVFQLLRPSGELHYYQKSKMREIDFILNKETAYEVKLRPSKQDAAALEKTSRELGMKRFKVVSKKHTDIKNAIYPFQL
jgi:uncharacterized protein